jgi:hypothetical protein
MEDLKRHRELPPLMPQRELPQVMPIQTISQIKKAAKDPNLVIHSNSVMQKTELLQTLENADPNNQDHMDLLIKDMLTKLKKG